MKTANLIDDREIYVYATKKSLLGGAAGAIAGLSILGVWHKISFLIIPNQGKKDNLRFL